MARSHLLLVAACLVALAGGATAAPKAHKVFDFMANSLMQEPRGEEGIKKRHTRCTKDKQAPEVQASVHATLAAIEEEEIATHGRRLLQLPSPKVMPIQFFIMYNGPATGGDTSYGNGYVPMTQITQQVAVMNKAYKRMNLQFSLLGATYVDNAAWWNRCDKGVQERNMKMGTRGRVGVNATAKAGIMTVWVCNLQSALGYTYLPPAPNVWADGMVVYYQTLPGGGFGNYNLGGTIVHESGHFFGLQHTFISTSYSFPQNGTCKVTTGDGIDDTPQEQAATGGCPQYGTKNTCSTNCGAIMGMNSTAVNQTACPGYGVDPTNNYMDYGNDNCYIQFTPGQFAKMTRVYKAFRILK